MSHWRTYLAVGAGSALGSLLRYGVSLGAIRLFGVAFPWGTLMANVLGCTLIGWLATRIAAAPHRRLARWQAFWVAGLCGGFTTFSLFSLETVHFLEQGEPLTALAYQLVSVPLWLAAVMIGARLARRPAHQPNGA